MPTPPVPQGDHWSRRAASAAAWCWDVEADREVFSREWKAMVGHAEHEIADSAAEWRHRVHPDDLGRAMARARAALLPGAPPYEDEYRLRHADGSWRRILSRGYVVERDARGHGVRMVGVDHDVGAEEALQDNVRQRDAIIALAERIGGLGWWTWDVGTDAVTWSPGMYKAFGIDPAQPAPSFAAQQPLYTPESFERLVAAAKHAMATGESYLLEVEIVQPGGARRSAIGIGEVVRDADGRPLAMRGVMNDVTELLLVQRGAREQAQLLAQVSTIGRIGGWSLDLIGNALSWTDETYRIHDLEPGEAIDVARAIGFYHPESRPLVDAEVKQSIETGVGFDFEARLVTAAGRTIWVRSRGELESVGGRPVRLAGTFQDITAAKQAQAKLAQVLEDLRARNRALQDFSVAASHDLQEPLRKIQTLGSLLADRFGDGMDAQARDWLERMRAAAGRMGDLVGDLLAYSRVDRHAPPPPRTDLGAVAAGVVSDLEVEIARSGASVEIGPLPAIVADPTQMRQVLQNLVGNALKYRLDERAPRVLVSAELVDLPAVATGDVRPHCRLCVTDNGIGFDARHAEQIFAPFQRLHDRSRYEGTGMGLAIVRRIAERHGGRVYARGRPGEGADFVLELPVDGPPPAPDPTSIA